MLVRWFYHRYFEERMPGSRTDIVEIKKVGDEERIVVAKRDIQKGEVIAEEAPFVAAFKAHAPVCTSTSSNACHDDIVRVFTLAPTCCRPNTTIFPQTSDYCFQCHKKLPGKPVQCKEKCGLEHYCSAECRDKAWEEHHRLFCSKKNAKPSSPFHRLTVCALA